LTRSVSCLTILVRKPKNPASPGDSLMALIKCPECGREVSTNAAACPHCGNPMQAVAQPPPPHPTTGSPTTGTYCPHCRVHVTPVVTSVGGGTCSFGKRETWKCPQCFRVLHRSGCFVATQIYGDDDLVEVLFLRVFRDMVLSTSVIGRITKWVYYYTGPFAARVVELLPIFKPICRRILDSTIDSIENKTNLRRQHFHKGRD
jgi:hypothetical protein